MGKAILLKGGQIITRHRLEPYDLLLRDGVIQKMERNLSDPLAETIHVEGLLVSPGFIDLHTHLREPGFSKKETIATGTKAAASGGYTTVCAMPNLSPVPDAPESLRRELDVIARDACIEVLPLGAITKGQAGQALSDMEAMAPFCPGFSDDGKGVQDDSLMLAAMGKAAALDRILFAHCEDTSLLTSGGCVHDGYAARRFSLPAIAGESEWRQIARDLRLAARTGVRYHVCHISTKEGVALVRKAKAEGVAVTCECTPHQLALCDEDIIEDHGRFKMNPPLRSRDDRDAIIAGLLDGTIDCITTDHAPHTCAEKSRGLSASAFGIVGLETAFAVCYTALVKTKRCNLSFLVDKLSLAPARILRREAAIQEGAPANLAIIDPNASWQVRVDNFYSKGKSTPFDGSMLFGRVVSTWYQGKNVFSLPEA